MKLDCDPTHEQNIFNLVKKEHVQKFRLKIQYVDTDYRGGSCNHGNDLNTVYTMHARCCVGLDWNKIHDLKNLLEDWKNY